MRLCKKVFVTSLSNREYYNRNNITDVRHFYLPNIRIDIIRDSLLKSGWELTGWEVMSADAVPHGWSVRSEADTLRNFIHNRLRGEPAYVKARFSEIL